MRRRTHERPDRAPMVFHGIYTVAPQMLRLFELLPRVAQSDASVLIRGETGTGKELVARALHELSPRGGRAFQAINCATLGGELLASELFGHTRGAFTGAIRDRQGLFTLADRGTIFLDEIAEMPLEIQAQLLRVLQEQSFVPVGASEAVKVDVRVLSATHKALREEVARRRFREDLMYRVRVVPLFLPRLCERDGDIEALTWHFIDHFNRRGGRTIERIDDDVLEALLTYTWPGNVRELRNAIEYAYAIGEGPTMGVGDLLPELRGEAPPARSRGPLDLEAEERERILSAMRASHGRKSEAARRLGINRSTLWRKLRELRIDEG
ncbi:MAG: sigma 54-interacting transcriptional regulator [Nannocystaceae bacterium]